MDFTRRSFLAGLGATSVGLLFRRQLDAVLGSLERDSAAELVSEPVIAGQAPSAIDVIVQPQAAFRPERLMIPGVVVGKEMVAETVWRPCASCSARGSDWDAVFCAACGSEGGAYVNTGKLVEREIRSSPWIIEDITIGDRSQLAGAGGIPGDVFSPTSPDAGLMLDAAAPGASIRFRVRYVGDDPAGARFQAALLGRSIGPDGRPRRNILPIDSGCAIVA